MPDQRGFGGSDRPEGTERYAMGTLVLDVVGLLDWGGFARAGIVGHDFGSAVTWATGALVPDRVTRAVTLCAPHPLHFRRAAIADPRQVTIAFYAWLMNIGEAGERLLAARDFRFLSDWAFGGTGVDEDLVAAYRAEWARPGAFHAMAEWYRANYTPDLLNPDVDLVLPPVRVPVRSVHAGRDWAFVPGMASGSGDFVAAEYDEHVVEDATHWIVHERPDLVADLIRDWMLRPAS